MRDGAPKGMKACTELVEACTEPVEVYPRDQRFIRVISVTIPRLRLR